MQLQTGSHLTQKIDHAIGMFFYGYINLPLSFPNDSGQAT